MGVTQNLASGRASYADRLSQINQQSASVQAAATLGQARTTSAAIGALGQNYQNQQSQPNYGIMAGDETYNESYQKGGSNYWASEQK